MPKIHLKGYRYVGKTANGNYKFTRRDSKGRNMPFYLSPSEYRRVKKKAKI